MLMSSPSIRNVFYNCQMFDDIFLELSVHMKYVGREEKTALTICNLPACERNMEVADNIFQSFGRGVHLQMLGWYSIYRAPTKTTPFESLLQLSMAHQTFCQGAPDLHVY